MVLVFALLALINAVLAMPVAVFTTEILASLLPRRPIRSNAAKRPSVALIVPAHNEAMNIAGTVAALRRQLQPDDRLIVVADNCSDNTATLAAAAGAEVITRSDPTRRGKGFALDFGVRHLAPRPPEIVIFVDADCLLSPGSIDHLARAAAGGHPAQGLYLMAAPRGSDIRSQVAELAFLIKNQVRPSGLASLGFGCQLTGAGMAFPWSIISTAQLAHGSLVEDMKLGLELALAGTPPRFCPEARIDSVFPQSTAGIASQRSRWEEGHIAMVAMAAKWLPRALATRNWGAVALIFDTMVPPLTLLLLLVGTSFAVTAGLTFGLGLDQGAFWLALANGILLGLASFIAWYRHGRNVLPAHAVMGIFPYMLGKFGLYRALASGKRNDSWIRTDRGDKDPS